MRLKVILDIYKGKKTEEVLDTPIQGSNRYIQIDDLRNDENLKYTMDTSGVLAHEDDVLIAWDGANAGTVGYGLNGYIGSTIAILRNHEDKLFTPYLGRFLQSNLWYLQKTCTGATIPHINRKSLLRLDIPLPPLEEQKRIAAILDKADQLRQQRQRAIDRLDDLLQSVFLDMFGDPVTNPMGWETGKIGDLTQVKTGGTPRRDHPEYYDGNIPWVKTTEVVNSVILTTEETITELGLNNSNCRVFPKDTIIIAMYGQGLTRGRTAKLGISATTNQACAAILPSQSVVTDYLWAYLQLSYEKLRALGRGGNQPNLNLTMIKNFEVLLPQNELQIEFADIVHETYLQRQQFMEQLKSLDGLIFSIQQRAFRGEL